MPSDIRTLNQILADFLIDVLNVFPSADLSQGTLAFGMCAAAASQIAGLENKNEFTRRQIHADSSTPANLERHGLDVGLARQPGESDFDYLQRLLAFRSEPPAGGNQFDYKYWAEVNPDVALGKSYDNPRGNGTVDVVIVAELSTGSEIPTAQLLIDVFDFIDPLRPVGLLTDDGGPVEPIEILAVSILLQNVSMTASGNIDTAVIEQDITAYLNGLEPDQPLDPQQISAIAIANGAVNPVVGQPAATVIPNLGEMIRPGVIDVTKI